MDQAIVRSIMDRVIVTDSGCWEWQGPRVPRGYGRLRGRYVHRIMCEAKHGPLDPGIQAMHSCDNPPCCNPEHLRPGTGRENMREAVDRGRLWMTATTHCPRGHEYSPENTKIDTRGKRRCRECARRRSREAYAANPEYWRDYHAKRRGA